MVLPLLYFSIEAMGLAVDGLQLAVYLGESLGFLALGLRQVNYFLFRPSGVGETSPSGISAVVRLKVFQPSKGWP
jgi:hypothetical protein